MEASMPRPKLTPLAALLPPKGGAMRPEEPEFGEKESEHASKQTIDPHTPNPGDRQAADQRSKHARIQPAKLSSKQASIHGYEHEGLPVKSDDPDEYQNGPRSAVSFRMTEHLQDRLREYAHQTRRKKQDVLDQAVHEFLRREGF
jgi:hypothetical protein